ncbi:MAG: hypothetical protein ACK5KR_05125 [Breznakia sp.]
MKICRYVRRILIVSMGFCLVATTSIFSAPIAAETKDKFVDLKDIK